LQLFYHNLICKIILTLSSLMNFWIDFVAGDMRVTGCHFLSFALFSLRPTLAVVYDFQSSAAEVG